MTGVSMADAVAAVTLRVAVLKVREAELGRKVKAARLAAQALYAEHRKAGNRQVAPVLPGGTEAGTVSIRAGATDVRWDEAALLALVEETDPPNAEDYVPASALTDKRVIDLIKEVYPGLVERRVNPDRKRELEEAVTESDGVLLNTATGERIRVADVVRHDPNGDFAYLPGKKGAALILAALAAGTVTEDGEIAAPPEPQPLPPPPEPQPGDPLAWLDEVGCPDATWGDEHGFHNPETAAAHAVLVQGGFTTPPAEAYRMLRDATAAGDETAFERTLAWLQDHGLDPDDPAQGKDTPWPLPEVTPDAV